MWRLWSVCLCWWCLMIIDWLFLFVCVCWDLNSGGASIACIEETRLPPPQWARMIHTHTFATTTTAAAVDVAVSSAAAAAAAVAVFTDYSLLQVTSLWSSDHLFIFLVSSSSTSTSTSSIYRSSWTLGITNQTNPPNGPVFCRFFNLTLLIHVICSHLFGRAE